MTTALGLLGVIGLIVATGWFVAGEFAFVAASRNRLDDMANAGDRKAARALELGRRLSFVLSGAQLGITVTSLVVGYLAEPVVSAALAPLFEAIGFGRSAASSVATVVAFVLVTYASMVIGELAPKNLAIAKSDDVARALAGGLTWYMRLAAPLIRLFDGAANGLLRLVGVQA